MSQTEENGATQNIIEVKDLIFEVPGKRILKNINLSIDKGEIVSVMGVSGSGKTTLLKMLSGLLIPTSGSILIDGQDITRANEQSMDQIRHKMGMVFQYAALFDSLNVYENIIFGVKRNRKGVKQKELDRIVEERLEQVQLPGIESKFPSELSGGMQKRVGLARALAMEPAIVYYDEPTSGLDPITALTIDNLIVDTRKKLGVTSVMVSHQLSSIFRISDRIAMMHQGEILIYGTPDEVRASDDPAVKYFLDPEKEPAPPEE